MKYFLLVITCLFLSSQHLSGQLLRDVKIGPDNEQTARILKIFGEKNNAIYALGGSDKDYFVQKYNPRTLQLTESRKMDLPQIDQLSKVQIEEFFMMNSSLIVLFSGIDRSTETVEVHAYKVNTDCTLSRTGKKVLSVPVEKKRNLGDVGIEYNPRINRVLIYHHFRSKASKSYKLTVVSVDEELSDIAIGSHDLNESTGKDYRLLDVLLSDNGDIYALDNNIDSDDELNWKYKQQELHFVSFKKNGESFATEEEILNVGADYYITDGILYSDGKRLSISGFYVDLKVGKGNELDGCYHATILDDGKVDDPTTFKFTEEFRNKFDTRFGSRVHMQGSMKIQEAFTINGSTYVVAENYYLSEEVPVYENMLIYKLDRENGVQWAQALPKKQSYTQVKVGFAYGSSAGGFSTTSSVQFNLVSADKGNYLSYFSWMDENENMLVLYNDSKRNAELTGEGERKWLLKPQDGVPMIAKITPAGDISYQVEESLQTSEMPLRPKYSTIIGEKLFFVSGRNSKESLSSAVFSEQ